MTGPWGSILTLSSHYKGGQNIDQITKIPEEIPQSLETKSAPPPYKAKERDLDAPCLQMKGTHVFKISSQFMSHCYKEILKKAHLNPSEIDWLIPHQGSLRVITALANKLEISLDKVIIEVKDVGNTGAGSIPIAMDRALRKGQLHRGQNIMLMAFGGGLTSGGLLLKF